MIAIATLSAVLLAGYAGWRALQHLAFGALTLAALASAPLLWSDSREPGPLLAMVAATTALAAIAAASRGDGVVAWVLAGLALGAGVSTTWSALVMMPLDAALILLVGSTGSRATARQLGAFTAALVVAALPSAFFLLRHLGQVQQTISGLRLYDTDRFNVLQGLREMSSWVGLTARSEVYYDFFNPAFLFLSGDVLLWPMVFLVPVGVYCLIDDESLIARFALVGFFASPFAAALTAEAPLPRRSWYMLPFAALIAAYGTRQLVSWTLRRRPSSADIDALLRRS